MKTNTRRLDSIWREKVREKYNNKCPHCNSKDASPHHLISRKNRRTKWVVENGIFSCNILHRLFETKRGNEKRQLIKNYVGEERYSILIAISTNRMTPEEAGFEVVK